MASTLRESLFVSLGTGVKPHLEYCIPFWGGHLQQRCCWAGGHGVRRASTDGWSWACLV